MTMIKIRKICSWILAASIILPALTFMVPIAQAQSVQKKAPVNPYDLKDFISASDTMSDADKKEVEEKYKAAEEAMLDANKIFKSAKKEMIDKYDSALWDGAISTYFSVSWDTLMARLKNAANPLAESQDKWLEFQEIFLGAAAETKDSNPEASATYMEAAKLAEQLNIAHTKYKQAQSVLAVQMNPNGKDDEVYVHISEDGHKTYFRKKDYSFLSGPREFIQGNYESVAGVTKGCMPLPAKVAENKTCIFCPLFLTIFNAAQTMATNSYAALAKPIANVMMLGFAIFIAFLVLKYVSAFTKQDAPKFTNEILIQAFKVITAYILLMNASFVYEYIVGPVLSAGMEFGSSILFEHGSSYVEWCSVEQNLLEQVGKMEINPGLLPQYLYVKLDCFIRSVQAEISKAQSIGSTLMCVARHTASETLIDIKIVNIGIWDFSMFFQGLIVWFFAVLISLAFAFYLIDATVRLGIIGALMPFFIASWPFKATSGYTQKGWTMFLNTFFTYVMMGLVVSINIQLIMKSLVTDENDSSALEDAINGDSVTALQQMLDIGFSGFLILLACCLFGFKITAQATALASTFAGGGGDGKIGSSIGTLAASGAAGLAVGTEKGKVGGAAGFVKNSAAWASRKTGLTAAASKAGAGAKAFVGRALGLGRYGGKAGKENQQGATPNQRQPNQPQPGQPNQPNPNAPNPNTPNPNTPNPDNGNGGGNGGNPPPGGSSGGGSGGTAPQNAGPRNDFNPATSPEVRQAMQAAEQNLHEYAGHKKELEAAQEKVRKAEEAVRAAQAEAARMRAQADAARGSPQEARFENMAQAAQAKAAAIAKTYAQAQANQATLQQTVNNDAVNTYVNQRKAILRRNGKPVNEEELKAFATSRVNDIKNNLDVLLKTDPRYN